jgi:hypothetical protein
MADTVVDLGAGSPELTSMNEALGLSPTDEGYTTQFPGEVFSGDELIPLIDKTDPFNDFYGRQQTTPGYEAEFLIDPSIETEDITDETKFKRFDPYQDFPEPLVPGVSDPNSALKLIKMGITRTKPPYQEDNIEAGRPRYENVFSDQGVQAALEEGGIVDLPMDFGTMEGEVDDFDMLTLGKTPPPEPADRGIGGLLMYEDLADPQYPLRPIQSQNFGKKRGFQYGQMVQLNDRDDAVGGKLLKQAGIQAPANQVLATLDPKVVDQMSRVLGRDIG